MIIEKKELKFRYFLKDYLVEHRNEYYVSFMIEIVFLLPILFVPGLDFPEFYQELFYLLVIELSSSFLILSLIAPVWEYYSVSERISRKNLIVLKIVCIAGLFIIFELLIWVIAPQVESSFMYLIALISFIVSMVFKLTILVIFLSIIRD